MFDDKFITNAIKRSGETALDRRRLLTMAGIAGVSAATLLAAAEPATAADVRASRGGHRVWRAE